MDHEEWLRLKLEELNEVERRIDAVRPRNRIRERVLVLFLLMVVISTGMAVSFDPTVLGSSLFGLAIFVSIATVAVMVSPRHRMKALEWRREELLAQIGTRASPGG